MEIKGGLHSDETDERDYLLRIFFSLLNVLSSRRVFAINAEVRFQKQHSTVHRLLYDSQGRYLTETEAQECSSGNGTSHVRSGGVVCERLHCGSNASPQCFGQSIG